jgi:hypothetical protein
MGLAKSKKAPDANTYWYVDDHGILIGTHALLCWTSTQEKCINWNALYTNLQGHPRFAIRENSTKCFAANRTTQNTFANLQWML